MVKNLFREDRIKTLIDPLENITCFMLLARQAFRKCRIVVVLLLIEYAIRMRIVMVLAPGTPQPIMNALRRGFDDMVRDPAFIADAKQGLLDVSPTSGETLQSRVTEMMASPPDIVTKFRALVGAEAK